jgi:hypothetical protein
MSNKTNPIVAMMGIDIGKNSFHVVGLNQRGAIVLRRKWSRGQIEMRLSPFLSGLGALAVDDRGCPGARQQTPATLKSP